MRRRAMAAGALAVAVLLAASALVVAAVFQQGGVRITVLSQIKPYRLPRAEPAPIAVFVAGHLSTAGGGIPPQLERLAVKVNRHGLLRSEGLPICRVPQIQPATTQRALRSCNPALIGSGMFWASIVLPAQRPYPTRGRLLIFNGRQGGHRVVLAHIFTSNPFNTSFVIAFRIRHVSKGAYGTELSASLPEALGSWGYLNRIKLTLRRKYRYRDRELSYFNAACPAPAGTSRTAIPLAYVTFSFAEQPSLGMAVTKTCAVKE